MLALTRKIFADEAGEDSVEDVFARAQQVVAEAEELLVDAGWSAPSRWPSRSPPDGDSGRDEAAEPGGRSSLRAQRP